MNSFKDKNQKIALIGCGYWGTILAKTLTELKFKNIYIYDSNISNSKTLKNKFPKLTITNTFLDILKDNQLKNIFFATPPSINYRIVKKALLYKKNVFLEKPGVVKISEIKSLNMISKKNKNKLMFGYVYCYNDYIRFIHELLRRASLGKILYINFQRQNLGPIRNDVNVADDLSSHDLSIILYLFKKLPTVLNHVKYSILKKNIYDISNLHMKLKNIYIDINNSWLNPTKIRTITIIGSKKMLLFDEMNINEPIKIYHKYAEYPKIHEFDKSFFKSKALIHVGKNFSPKIKSKPALVNEIKHFFNSDMKKSKILTDYKFSFEILKVLKKI